MILAWSRLLLNLAEEAAPDLSHVQMEARLRAIIDVLGRGLQQEAFRYEDVLKDIDLKDIDALLAVVSSRMLKQEWESTVRQPQKVKRKVD